jgi:hypothetical protein
LQTTFCTLAAKNYESRVNLLIDSFNEFHSDYKFIIFSGDELELKHVYKNVEVRKIDNFDASLSARLIYSKAKPSILRTLLAEGHHSIIYLDPDMLVIENLGEIINTVHKYSLTLTPHILNSGECELIENYDRTLLNTGVFNAGFIGLTDSFETRKFLSWWDSKMFYWGETLPSTGMNFDQRWLDFAPGFLNNFRIIRDPGLNLGYFNIIFRRIELTPEGYFINGSILKLMHFSGFDPACLPSSNIYYPEIKISDFKSIEELYYVYAKKLLTFNK